MPQLGVDPALPRIWHPIRKLDTTALLSRQIHLSNWELGVFLNSLLFVVSYPAKLHCCSLHHFLIAEADVEVRLMITEVSVNGLFTAEFQAAGWQISRYLSKGRHNVLQLRRD